MSTHLVNRPGDDLPAIAVTDANLRIFRSSGRLDLPGDGRVDDQPTPHNLALAQRTDNRDNPKRTV